MKVLHTYLKLLFAFVLFSLQGQSQDLSGVWRGEFYNLRELMYFGSKYRYELQFVSADKAFSGMKGAQGVTYSYQDKRFYGKASCMGIWNPESKVLTLMEDKMLDLKIEGGGDGCLMTCYLEYRKEDGVEILEGTYTSVNMNNKEAGCGGGRVRLEKVPDSEFGKEDFLVEHEAKRNTAPKATGPTIKPGQEEFLVKKDSAPAKTTPPVVKTTPPPVKKTTPPPATKPPATKPPAKEIPPVVAQQKTEQKPAPATPEKTIPKPELPQEVRKRKNEVFDVITTRAKEITISMYDNGEVDGDIISVFHNNKMLSSGQLLSAKPLVYTIKLSEDEPDHEILVVAENQGSIPPNTALVIVQAGTERYNIRISSSDEKNAVIRFRYQP